MPLYKVELILENYEANYQWASTEYKWSERIKKREEGWKEGRWLDRRKRNKKRGRGIKREKRYKERERDKERFREERFDFIVY